MTPRNTRTGGVLERMILPALAHGGYSYKVQVNIGQRLGCGNHFVDAVAEKNGERLLISVKWQQKGGTAEQKVPFEVICLADALAGGSFSKAFLVLGGIDYAAGDRGSRTPAVPGWKLRTFYVSGGLKGRIVNADKVEILTLEGFVVKANEGRL